MATYPTIEASVRTEFGKGFARRLRRDWKVPGVIYSAETETLHFAAPLLEIQALVRNHGVNAVVEMDIEGEKHLTMVKHVDQNPLTLNIDHIDLLAIKRGEKVEVEVPVVIEGEPTPGTIAILNQDLVLIEADVLNIPEEIVVNVEGLEADDQVLAGDLKLGDATLVEDAENVVVTVSWPEVDEELEEAAEAAEEGGAEAGAESTEEAAE